MRVQGTDGERRHTISGLVAQLETRLIDLRRDLHAHPEVGNLEHRTTAVIVEELERAGLVAKVLPIGTGAYCDILPAGFDYAEGLIGFRADIDALPITDGKDVPYASQNPGVCHACGHDVHTAIMVGLGLVLAQLRDADLLPRGVRLIFQPAEESSPGGALDAIDGGVLQDLTEIYALHCDPRTDVGQLAFKVGAITSAVDQVDITLTGVGGHTSRPHLTQDIIGALGELATTTQLVLSRRVDPRSGVSLMWGSVHAGSVANAIPGSREDRGHAAGPGRLGLAAGQEPAARSWPPTSCGRSGSQIEVEVTDGVPPDGQPRAGHPANDPGHRAGARSAGHRQHRAVPGR